MILVCTAMEELFLFVTLTHLVYSKHQVTKFESKNTVDPAISEEYAEFHVREIGTVIYFFCEARKIKKKLKE